MSENINSNLIARAMDAVSVRIEKLAKIKEKEEEKMRNVAESVALRIIDLFISSNEEDDSSCWVWKVHVSYKETNEINAQYRLQCSIRFDDGEERKCIAETTDMIEKTIETNRKDSMCQKLKATIQEINKIKYEEGLLNKLATIINEIPGFEAFVSSVVLEVTMKPIE